MRLKKTIQFLLFVPLFFAVGFGQNPELLPVRTRSIPIGSWDMSQYRAKNILLEINPQNIAGVEAVILGDAGSPMKRYDGLTPQNFAGAVTHLSNCTEHETEMIDCGDGFPEPKCVSSAAGESKSKGGSVYIRWISGTVSEFEQYDGTKVGQIAASGAYVITLSHDEEKSVWQNRRNLTWSLETVNRGHVLLHILPGPASGTLPGTGVNTISMATNTSDFTKGGFLGLEDDKYLRLSDLFELHGRVVGFSGVVRTDPKQDGTWDLDRFNRRTAGARGRGFEIGVRPAGESTDIQIHVAHLSGARGPRSDLEVCRADDAVYQSPMNFRRIVFLQDGHVSNYQITEVGGVDYWRGLVNFDYSGDRHDEDRVANPLFNPVKRFAIPFTWSMTTNLAQELQIPIGNLDPRKIADLQVIIHSNPATIDEDARIFLSPLNLDKHTRRTAIPSSYDQLSDYGTGNSSFSATGKGGGVWFDASTKTFRLNAIAVRGFPGPAAVLQYASEFGYGGTANRRGYLLVSLKADHDGDHSLPGSSSGEYGDPLWVDLDIGSVDIAAGNSQSTLDGSNVARSFTVNGSGFGPFGGEDHFRYVFKEPPEQQIVFFRADVTIPSQPPSPNGLGGLMVRQSLNPNSPFLFVGTNQAGELVIRKRDASGATAQGLLPPTAMTGTRIEITINDFFTIPEEPGTSERIVGVEVVGNGQLIHSDDASFTFPYYIGVAVSSGDNENLFQAEFDNVEVLAALVGPSSGDGSGQITKDVWKDISGTSVSSLTGAPDYPENPTYSTVASSFRGSLNAGDDYGTRMYGFVHPPATGDYTFWIASDDNSELWLSTNDNPANKSLIASVPSWVSPEFWDQFSSQKSTTINLEKGKKYFIEAIAKEGVGLDNLAVAWEGPGITRQVIPGDHLSPFVGDPFDGKTFELKFLHSSKCLDAFNTFPGANVGQWNCHSGDNQKWKFNYQGNGYYMLKEIRDNLCLEVQDGSTSSAANVQVGDCNVSDKRLWQVIMPDSNVIQLKNKKSSKVVDVEGFSTASGANVIQYFSNGQDNQKLIFTEVSNGFVCEGDCLSAEPLEPEVNAVLNTTGERWYVVSQDLDGWQASEMAGRTIQVNGVAVSPGHMPLPPRVDGNYYFHFSAGDHPWASWGYWNF